MSATRRINLVATAVLLFSMAGGMATLHAIDHMRRGSVAQEALYLRSSKVLRRLSLGYTGLLADIYWTRAVQYYGGKRLGQDTNLESLWPLLDAATTLDPNLLPAYRFGATFLGEPAPRGAGRPDLAIELLQRGMKENPEYWRLDQDLGNIYYFELKDYSNAGQAYLNGSKKRGAAAWMKIMAARLLEKGDSRETAAMLWTEVLESSTDDSIKENARVNLELLRSDEDIDQINEISAQFAEKIGRAPKSTRELMKAGLLEGQPVDPDGYAYEIGPDGKAGISESSPLFKQRRVYRQPL